MRRGDCVLGAFAFNVVLVRRLVEVEGLGFAGLGLGGVLFGRT